MYLIDGQRLDAVDPRFDQALAEVHTALLRPLCLCRSTGIPMYMARLGGDYLLKRMPYTGSQHAPACPSYELPPDVLEGERAADSAVVENPDTGLTTVRLGLALSRWEARAVDRNFSDQVNSVSSSPSCPPDSGA